MHKNILGTAAVAFSLIVSPAVFADSMACKGGMKHMVESLKLDDAQKTKIKPVLEQLKSTMKDDGSQMKDLDQQIDKQAQSATMDQSTVNDLIDKKAKLIGDMMKAKVTAKNQIYAVLNPQQKNELQSKMQKMEEQIANDYKSCHDQD